MKILLLNVFCCWLVLYAAPADPVALSKTEKIILKKNFYFLYLLEQEKIALSGQPFKAVSERLRRDAAHAHTKCATAACYGQRLQFAPAEMKSIGNELVRLSLIDAKMKALIRTLKASGDYPLFAAGADTSFIRQVWLADAAGINYILGTYIEGKAPLYPKIDAGSFKNDDPIFRNKIGRAVNKLLAGNAKTFYRMPMLLALKALAINERDEAARYEPIYEGENAAAFRKARKVMWPSYPYSVILVPGLGPEEPNVNLDPGAAKRCDSAAIRYHEGKAPFLVVSGGHVHPAKTPYCEALEMKKYLVNIHHIPAADIIIEPHARHTTTNLRNTNRIIYRFAIPSNKPVLIVTDAAQNGYITGSMQAKVVKELGYVPFTSIKKLSATETEYLPSKNSLHINSTDPLDP
jgi:hypothetical protein